MRKVLLSIKPTFVEQIRKVPKGLNTEEEYSMILKLHIC